MSSAVKWINPFSVVCPRCEAAPGHPCTLIVGSFKTQARYREYPHPARVELARKSA